MDDNMEKIYQQYIELFAGNSFLMVSDKLDAMADNEETSLFREELCMDIVHYVAGGYITYGKNAKFDSWENVQLFIKNFEKLHNKYKSWEMLVAFFKGKYDECMLHFDSFCNKIESGIQAGDELCDESFLVEYLTEPMKDAFPGFWSHAQDKMEKLCLHNGTHELCHLMDQIYSCISDNEAVDILTEFIQKYPDILVAKEYLACIYFNLKMYQNAIAWFESIGEDENTMLFAMNPARREMLLGYAYDKIRNYKEAEAHYRKGLEFDPNSQYVMNDLGYNLYKQRRYDEALEIFKQCVDEKKDLPYAANNYLRTLIASKRYSDAKDFVDRKEFKLDKSLIEKLGRLSDSNQEIVAEDSENNDNENDRDIGGTDARIYTKVLNNRESSQFSTEKILEDELAQRIENGMPVFGLKLKMYKRKGEYGRQYIIPVGRLDLFCEDESGNLYVIELKKDSGYDDAYVQTSEYLDWFASSPRFEDRKVYGIICLNNPSADLVSKVKADERIRLFEYQVSYTEIR